VSKHHKPIQSHKSWWCGYNILWGNHTELGKYKGILVLEEDYHDLLLFISKHKEGLKYKMNARRIRHPFGDYWILFNFTVC
jgi:hypothetical protein